MNPYLSHMTDRELLEQIYILLLQLYSRVDRIDDDNKEFSINLAADLLGDVLQKNVFNNGTTRNN